MFLWRTNVILAITKRSHDKRKSTRILFKMGLTLSNIKNKCKNSEPTIIYTYILAGFFFFLRDNNVHTKNSEVL